MTTTANFVRIDRGEVEKLFKTGGAIFTTVFYASPMDKAMRKTGNPYSGKGLVKECSINGCVGFDYAAAVNRLAAKEGKPERASKPRAWGILRADRKFVDHKGEVYLQIMARSATTPVYRIGRDVIDAENVKPFLYEKGKSSTQSDLDGEVICRDIKLENILAIRLNGIHYIVADLEPVTTMAEVLKAKIDAKFDELVKAHSEALKKELDDYLKGLMDDALGGIPVK